MLAFIQQYGIIIVAIILLLLFIYVAFNRNLRLKAYSMMLWAERNFPDDAGRSKFLFVLGYTYPLLPGIIKKVMTKDMFAKILQVWYNVAKDILDDGILDQSTGGA